MDPDYAYALRALDAIGLPYAELWRMLIPVSDRLGAPRPSYSTVRRIVAEERRRKLRRKDVLDDILTDIARGMYPRALRSPL